MVLEQQATEAQQKAIMAIGRGLLKLSDAETDAWVMERYKTLPPGLTVEQARDCMAAMQQHAVPKVVAGATTDNIRTNRVIEMAPERRETLIVRQSSLKAALDFCCPAGRQDAELPHVEDVLTVAEQFEAWVMR